MDWPGERDELEMMSDEWGVGSGAVGLSARG